MRVEWVHPSWRDLVIGRLAGDAQARQSFVSHSGVHGLVLALSTAGGTAGERRLPLVGCDQDWDALTDRLYALVSELELPELSAVCAALSEAIDELGKTAGAGEARAAARTLLARVAAWWDSSDEPIAIDALAAWIAVARRLAPRPQPPDLSLTWVELLPACAPDLDDRAGLERFADWLGVCELLWDYDPALRDRLGFGTEQAYIMVAFMGRVERSLIPEERAALARATTDPTLRALDSIAGLQPELAGYAQYIRGAVRRDLSAAAPPEPTPESSYYYRGEAFDVRRVLVDL